MRKTLTLIVIDALTIGLSFLFFYLSDGHLFRDSISHYIIISIALLLAVYLLGLICWLVFSRRKDKTMTFLIAGNSLGLAFVFTANIIVLYKHWHYDHYQANIDYNESLRKQGGYLDTCMTFAQKAILREVNNPNDFRILSYTFDLALTTIPRDTTNRYYDFILIYKKYQGSDNTIRVAKFLANTRQDFKQIFDLDIRDDRAKPVVDSFREDFIRLKENLGKIKASDDQSLTDLKKALAPLN